MVLVEKFTEMVFPGEEDPDDSVGVLVNSISIIIAIRIL